jgi:hypothetical protein
MARPKLNPNTVDKVCPTCQKTFTISFYLRNRRTFCSKSCANHDSAVIEKMKASQIETFSKKYGMHPMKTEKTKENLRQSVKEKYGVDWISQKDGWYDTVKKNNLEKHGLEHYNNIEKIKQTCLDRYGVPVATKAKVVRDSITHTKTKTHYRFLIDFCQTNNLELKCPEADYKGYHWSFIYKFSCKKCGHVFDSTIYSLETIFCEQCNPNKKQTLENMFFDFLHSAIPGTTINRRDRSILYGKELDFYLPEKKIAFELNGLYWHSENGTGILKNYHLNKTKGCLAHGVRLIHIFENEWRDQSDLVKSVVRTILKVQTQNTIPARICEIKEVATDEKNQFLNENHLQREDKSTIKLGLYHDKLLVSLMTFRKTSRFDKNVEWELSRFCNLQNHIVIGGASRLFSHFLKTLKPASIVSYCDRRYFSGDLYHTLGFSFVGNTVPSYHYITPDYKSVINRMQFQKHLLVKKLSQFDPNLTEWENMKNNGFDRIWDCGCSKWVFHTYDIKHS